VKERTTNLHTTELETEAYATVPAIVHAEAALRDVLARQRTIGHVPTADEARDAVFEEAFTTLREGNPYPADVGKRATAAYLKAMEAEYDARCVNLAVHHLRATVDSLKDKHTEDALSALGEIFDGFLTELRAAVADLGGARSAEAAVMAGGKAPEAWRKLTALVGRLGTIREAQNLILRRDVGDSVAIGRLRKKGLFEVRSVDMSDVPENVRGPLTTGAYHVPYLLWLSEQDAYVPASYDDMASNDVAPDAGTPDGPVRDFSPSVQPAPAVPRAPLIPPHATNPALDGGALRVPVIPNGTVGDPNPYVPRY
jgi:hypothetical protein